MTMANTFAGKAGVAFVAIAMALVMVAPAQAATAEETQAQIDALMAQLAALTATTPTASADAYVFTRSLTIGAQGADVTALQNYLIAGGYSIPAGATGYFGAQTAAAVAAWQTANGVMPAAGYFGPVSQAKYAALMAATPADDSDDDADDSDDSDDTTSGDLGDGEGDISVSAASADDSDVEEGESGEVYAFDVEVEGDVEINRVDVYMEVVNSGSGSEDADDYFAGATLLVDGEEVADLDVDDFDEDDFDNVITNGATDDDEYRLRFSDLGLVFADGDEPEFVVVLEANNSIDSDDRDESWTIGLDSDSVRFVDGEGFNGSDGDSGEETFGFEEEGANESLEIQSSSDDPDDMTLLVDEDDESDWYEVFIFSLEAEENDMNVDELVLTVNTDSANYDDIVEDAKIEIDGEEFDDFDVTGGGSTAATLTFEFDEGDVVIDADSEVDVTVWLQFKSTDDGANYGAGTTTVQVETVSVEGEGSTDQTDTATVVGGEHTLNTVVPVISDVESSISQANQVSNSGSIVFEFTIEADEDDVVFTKAALNSAATLISSASTTLAKPTPTLARISGDSATESPAGTFTVEEGDEVTFRLTYTFTTGSAHNNGNYSINLETIAGVEVDETSPNLTLAH